MKKFLEYINLPKNLKRYFIIKKMDSYTKDKKYAAWIIVIDFLIIIALAAIVCYIYFISGNDNLKIFGLISAVLFVAYLVIKISVFVVNYEKSYSGITKLIMIDENGSSLKSWDLGDRTSILIGKSTKESDVDIDLSDSEYAALVSRQHAVLNFANDSWYIEDIGSANGSGIKRANENSKLKMEKGTPYKINSGDTIYIANTKLLTK